MASFYTNLQFCEFIQHSHPNDMSCPLYFCACYSKFIRLFFYSPLYKIYSNLYKYRGSVCTGNSVA